jgi:hypothetical protein
MAVRTSKPALRSTPFVTVVCGLLMYVWPQPIPRRQIGFRDCELHAEVAHHGAESIVAVHPGTARDNIKMDHLKELSLVCHLICEIFSRLPATIKLLRGGSRKELAVNDSVEEMS